MISRNQLPVIFDDTNLEKRRGDAKLEIFLMGFGEEWFR